MSFLLALLVATPNGFYELALTTVSYTCDFVLLGRNCVTLESVEFPYKNSRVINESERLLE